MYLVQHKETREIKELTKEQYERFFDNRSPFDWNTLEDKVTGGCNENWRD